MILYEVLATISYFCVGVLCFWAGAMWKEDQEKKKKSARVIRPAKLTVNRHYHVTEYATPNQETLNLDFPPTKKV